MVSSTRSAFGSILRRFRLDAELTQEELAERAQISVRAISDLERGIRKAPYEDTIHRLCDALRLEGADRDMLLTSVSRRRGSGTDASSTPVSSTLPADLTPLLGREHDAADAARLLRLTSTRLLTLIGPGGVGKTRLSVRVAETLAKSYADGVWFVSLAPVTTTSRVPAAIAAALDIREVHDRTTVESLIDRLRDADTLLVLDNFEHLTDAATIVTDLLLTCPRLNVLVTSRAPLHLRGEHLFDVQPLRFPGLGTHLTASTAMQYSAIALFVQRAQALRSDFVLSEDAIVPVAAICARLDGLPLAIELAAAQVRTLEPVALLARLERSVLNLPLGPIDLPSRQQTMRAAIAWSYGLLTPAEQYLFRHLSVFRGGWSCEAAEAVASDSVDDILALLISLSDKSLIVRHAEGKAGARFSMLETVQEYSSECLASHAEEEAARHRHASHFHRLFQQTERAVREQGASVYSERLRPERNNATSALQWLATAGRLQEALTLAGSMLEFWVLWGHVREARGTLQWLLHLAADAGTIHVPGSALRAAARLAWIQTEYGEAASLYERALTAFREEGDVRGQAAAYTNLGTVAHLQSEYTQASTYYRQGLGLAREVNDLYGMAQPLSNLGLIAMQQGEYEQATMLLDGALALWRDLGNEGMIAVTLANRANLAFRQGAYPEAASLHEEVLAMKQKIGDPLAIAHSLGDLAWVEIERGNVDRARRWLAQALPVFLKLGQKVSVAECLEASARLAYLCQKWARSALLYGAASAIRTHVGSFHHPVDLARYQLAINELQTVMNPDYFWEAWNRGLVLPLDEAVVEALTSDEPPRTD